MKISELEKCLTGKLQLLKGESSRHTDYRLRCGGEIVALPTLLRVSRGSGEVANSNLGGIAKGLGLNEHALKEMASCHIGRACVLLCLSAKLLDFVKRLREEQGEVFRPGVMAMLESVDLLMSEPDLAVMTEWTGAERKMLDRVRPSVEQMCGDQDFGLVARRLVSRATMQA